MDTFVKLVLCLTALLIVSCTKDNNTEEPSSSSDVERLPILTENPVVGQSYKFSPDGVICSDGTKAKILFCCSSYDETLASLLDFYATGALHSLSREILDSFHETLCSFSDDFQRAIPEGGLLIWNDVVTNQTLGSTKHTIEVSEYVFDVLGGNIRYVDWLNKAVNGKVESYGLNLLNKN